MIPQLSIVIPAYNYGHYLSDAIDSILVQEFPSMELIIIDDGSTDNTPAIIEKYKQHVPYLRHIKHEKNRGIHYTINSSIDLARGEYIHWLAADDFRAPSFIKRSMQVLLANPHMSICCSDFGYVKEEKGRKILLSEPLIRGMTAPLILHPSELIKILRSTDFWIPGHTSIVKKESIIKHGRFKEIFREKCDWILLHQIALHEGVVYIPETLSYIYCHSQSYSAQRESTQKMRKTVALEILNFLFSDEGRSFKRPFFRSTLLRSVYRDLLGEFWKVKYWEFIVFLIIGKLQRNFRKIVRSF
ncbi:MAG: glycosyltransferase [Chlamydiae bacterium]|nr:glycosyltransferase [Chlamydiota bacterium]